MLARQKLARYYSGHADKKCPGGVYWTKLEWHLRLALAAHIRSRCLLGVASYSLDGFV